MQRKTISSILSLVLLASCQLPPQDKLASEVESEIKQQEVLPEKNESKGNDISIPSHVIGAPIPKSLDFCGEKVNLQDWDVCERLDYELTVNMYYHSKMQFYLKRANRWFPVIEPILKEEGLPDDFKYLAVIESALSQAISPSGAKGFWQFMTATGKEYDMEINKDVDERYHVEKSTRAACEYLKKAYKKFGNWTEAAASYNMGKAGLKNRMDQQYSNNYFDLKLNNETARYVFRLLAVKAIMKNPDKYGFHLSKEHLYPVYKTKKIEVSQKIEDLALWAKQNKLNYKIVKKLNPWILGNSLNASSSKTYEILIPDAETSLKTMAEYE